MPGVVLVAKEQGELVHRQAALLSGSCGGGGGGGGGVHYVLSGLPVCCVSACAYTFVSPCARMLSTFLFASARCRLLLRLR